MNRDEVLEKVFQELQEVQKLAWRKGYEQGRKDTLEAARRAAAARE
mgnify:CR=1 FL=1